MLSKRILLLLVALWPYTSLWAHNLTLSCPHKNIPFTVEVVTTPEDQAKGLMFRETLAEDAGMVFLYSTPGSIAMWMKNTPLSLDMIFGDETGAILAVYENATPRSLAIIGPVQGVSQVLELNSGIIKKHGITKACRLKLDAETPLSPEK
ncbi:MAG: DUF192 domain-containing protein [Proteobacteria bacterium]|nr:DUF192 domain-containing protein [Pseudomonadota bacterium]